MAGGGGTNQIMIHWILNSMLGYKDLAVVALVVLLQWALGSSGLDCSVLNFD